MNYRDLQNISQLSQQILTESTTDNDAMGRWPYSSPYLQEERAEGVKEYRPTMTQADVRKDAAAARQRHLEKSKGQKGYGPDEKFKDWKDRATPSSTLKRKKKEGGTEDETVSQRMNREKPYAKRMTGPLARKQGSRIASAVTRTIEGPGEPQAVTMPRMGRGEKAKPSREIVRKGKQEESFDLYDLILHHLMTEGFAETAEAATAIMANMSEAWVDNIVDLYIEG